MTDIMRAGMGQMTLKSGQVTDWKVSIGDEVLYTLGKEYTDKQMFEVRDVIKSMMDLAYKEGHDEMGVKARARVEAILHVGNEQLNVLKDENTRLANALEKLILSEEEI